MIQWSETTFYPNPFRLPALVSRTCPLVLAVNTSLLWAGVGDGNIPGNPIPASPIMDSVSESTDLADVFSIELAPGDPLRPVSRVLYKPILT
jgi:hypothetical protein